MRKFDIRSFLSRYGVEYIEKGANVRSKDHININCVLCREDNPSDPDPSFHLGIDTNTLYWCCWRNRGQHKGRTLHKLVMKIAKISYREACELLGTRTEWIEQGEFDQFLSDPDKFFSKTCDLVEDRLVKLDFPKEFHQFNGQKSSVFFIDYLINQRKIPKERVEDFIDAFKLRYSVTGSFSDRVIVPIYLDFELVTWTGRSRFPDDSLRYKTLSMKDGAVLPITESIFDFDNIINSDFDILFVHEGPFDAMNSSFWGRRYGARATCLFTLAASTSQIALISEIAPYCKKIIVMLDQGEEYQNAVRVANKLSFLGKKVQVGAVPEGFKDPGELTPEVIKQMVKEYKR